MKLATILIMSNLDSGYFLFYYGKCVLLLLFQPCNYAIFVLSNEFNLTIHDLLFNLNQKY